MKATFHKRDEQILYRLVMIFGRIPNRVNICLSKLVSTGFSVEPLSQWEESEMPRRFDDSRLLYLAKRLNGSIDRQTTSEKQQTRVCNQQLENLSIVPAVSVAGSILPACKNAALSAIGFTVEPKKAVGFFRLPSRRLVKPRPSKLALEAAIRSFINTVQDIVEIRCQAATPEDQREQLNWSLQGLDARTERILDCLREYIGSHTVEYELRRFFVSIRCQVCADLIGNCGIVGGQSIEKRAPQWETRRSR